MVVSGMFSGYVELPALITALLLKVAENALLSVGGFSMHLSSPSLLSSRRRTPSVSAVSDVVLSSAATVSSSESG